MGVFSIFSSKGSFDPNTFEKELTTITENINNNKQQVNKLQQRQKSLRRSFVRYMIIIYGCILAYCYATIPSNTLGKNRIEWFLRGQSRHSFLVIAGFPLFAVLASRAIYAVFQFFIKNKQNYLKTLQTKHKQKIEELKKITNFNKTNELINKYGDDNKQQLKNRATKSQAPPPQQQQQQQPLQKSPINQQLKPPQGQQQPNRAPSPVIPQPPAKRTFQDRVLDILIGSDNSESVENRYALICFNCFSHNGLAPPNTEDPSSIKFQCWKCGAMNGKGMLFDQKFNSPKNPPTEEQPKPAEDTKPVDVQVEEPIQEIIPEESTSSTTDIKE
ncbi:hypothetical protein SBY92_000935 [Candida maltosa Xu316]|uniref:Endoplasmic reticulum junction formation protein lunapark n=1 Tax=Candida maltosa (strain Xu316) TaxID=1245528 RepID=M3IIM8_CANMX|nr:putative transmembrane protein [Candida maltosa Xu316]